MTPEQHAECMQKGLCFGCGKQGHLGKDCPDRAGTSKPTQTKKYNGKELHQHIRSLLKDMNDEEIDEFWKESEAQGFYASTSVSPCLDIFNVSTAKIKSNSLSIPIQISGKTEKETIETLALIDSGAGGEFIDQNYAKNSGLDIQQLEKPLKVFNVDGTSNKRGTIKYFVLLDITVNRQQEKIKLLLTGLGKQRIILGFPWLNRHNPEINWKTGELNWRTTRKLF